MLMRFESDHGGHRAGDVIEASETYAAALLEQGVAVPDAQPKVERAVEPVANKRTATKKV
jgi:hypothetical protein